jgi:hypothetical protein
MIHGIYESFHPTGIRRNKANPLWPSFLRQEKSKKEKNSKDKRKCTKERVLHSSHHLRLFDLNAMTPKESKARPC